MVLRIRSKSIVVEKEHEKNKLILKKLAERFGWRARKVNDFLSQEERDKWANSIE